MKLAVVASLPLCSSCFFWYSKRSSFHKCMTRAYREEVIRTLDAWESKWCGCHHKLMGQKVTDAACGTWKQSVVIWWFTKLSYWTGSTTVHSSNSKECDKMKWVFRQTKLCIQNGFFNLIFPPLHWQFLSFVMQEWICKCRNIQYFFCFLESFLS